MTTIRSLSTGELIHATLPLRSCQSLVQIHLSIDDPKMFTDEDRESQAPNGYDLNLYLALTIDLDPSKRRHNQSHSEISLPRIQCTLDVKMHATRFSHFDTFSARDRDAIVGERGAGAECITVAAHGLPFQAESVGGSDNAGELKH